MLKDLLKEIEDLEKAKELLREVFIELGPYQTGEVSLETWMKVKNYFKFDDSE